MHKRINQRDLPLIGGPPSLVVSDLTRCQTPCEYVGMGARCRYSSVNTMDVMPSIAEYPDSDIAFSDDDSVTELAGSSPSQVNDQRSRPCDPWIDDFRFLFYSLKS